MKYNYCKFGTYCKFSHDLIPHEKHSEELDKLRKQLKDLEQEIIEKDEELKKKEEEIKMTEIRILEEKDKFIKLQEDKITNLVKENAEIKNKVKELEKEKENLKEDNKSLDLKGMFFDIFKIEMREKYGHIEEESDDDDLQGIQENDEPVQSSVEENQGYICDQCKFIGKTEAGLKTHKTVKHGRKSGSCSL